MTIGNTLVSRVEGIIDVTTKTSSVETAINSVLNRIARKYDFAVLMDEDTSVTTATDAITCTLPSLTNRIYRIVWEDDSNSSEIDEISPQVFDHKYPYPLSLGSAVPVEYCRRTETTIDLNCLPNDTKTLRIYRSKWPTELSDYATDEPEFIRMDDVIVAGVVAEMYHQLGLDTDANTWWTKYKNMLDEAHEKDAQSPNMKRIGVGFQDKVPYRGEYWANPFVGGWD